MDFSEPEPELEVIDFKKVSKPEPKTTDLSDSEPEYEYLSKPKPIETDMPCGFWEQIKLQMKLAMLPLKGLDWDKEIPSIQQAKWTEIITTFLELNDILVDPVLHGWTRTLRIINYPLSVPKKVKHKSHLISDDSCQICETIKTKWEPRTNESHAGVETTISAVKGSQTSVTYSVRGAKVKVPPLHTVLRSTRDVSILYSAGDLLVNTREHFSAMRE